MSNANPKQLSILRRKQVRACSGLARSTIYPNLKSGTFPRPVPPGPRAVGSLESELSDLVAERVRTARNGAKSAD